MTTECQNIEYKGIQKIRTGDKGFKELAVTCVCLANLRGGVIFVGYGDKTHEPPSNQTISQGEVNDAISKLRSLCVNVSLQGSDVLTHDNGGQYFEIDVFLTKSIATTSDGKIYLRIGDKCEPVRSEDIHRLANEKEAYQWELVCPKTVRYADVEPAVVKRFAEKIRASARVGEHIKQMTDREIADNYNFTDGDYLTYLGILWLGTAQQRSRIAFPITVQYIVYDDLDRKIRKLDWHNNTLSPDELLLDIEKKAIELTYFYEFPDGLFRKQVRHYHPKVIRELLLNAFAHRSFATSSDIMIEVYPDRLEISNPGGLPLGVTKDNILHARQRRNPHFITVMHDLELMEGEGSGYDLIYQLDAMDSKELPQIVSDFNYTTVIQSSKIINEDILPLLDYVSQNYDISQKNFIALGLIARYEKLLSTELINLLQLPEDDRLRSYTARLLELGLIESRGIKKGNTFLVSPTLISNSKVNIKTSLKTVEPHRLMALIEEDLRLHPKSKSSDIQSRLVDISVKEIRKYLKEMETTGRIKSEGIKKGKVYLLA